MQSDSFCYQLSHSNFSSVIGFSIKSSTCFDFSALLMSSGSMEELSMYILGAGVSEGSNFSYRTRNSKPSTFGILMSSRMISGVSEGDLVLPDKYSRASSADSRAITLVVCKLCLITSEAIKRSKNESSIISMVLRFTKTDCLCVKRL